ncbi:carboxylesterase/lipase family protein [Leifsonia sp. YAF41]|uniref:carboxylesterase/lipase family protein n=1 Tax=Leifsonia sp. YAF41 TaxID=3233086 RepID=UPI003F9D7550
MTDFIEAQTTAGRVRGFWRGESAAFLGIPFAEPPIGELRFAAPVPHKPWEGIRDALEHGATPQRGNGEITLIPEPSVEGESTLNVNVFTPAPGGTGGLPVLVYIHGGGYFSGSPASPWYDGASFNRDGVVTVSVSYRLGFDGFGWIEDAPHNRGVRDWLLALEWVRDNIANFGGDPSRVTIVGQSAGGGAVFTLLGMPAAQPLFHSAYSISGALGALTLEAAEQLGRSLAAEAGVAPTRAGLSTLSEERLMKVQNKVTGMEGGLAGGNPMDMLNGMINDGLKLGPVIDGELIPVSTIEAIRSGVGGDKPLVLGTTDDEFSMIFAEAKDKLKWIPANFLLGKLGLRGRARSAYRAANRDVKGTAAVLGRYVTDKMFLVAAMNVADARGTAPTWLYRFAWRSPVSGFAGHCLDVPFFFDCLSLDRVAVIAGDNPPQSLADEIHGDAVSFVESGDPGWPRFTEGHAVRVFDLQSKTESNGTAAVRALVA